MSRTRKVALSLAMALCVWAVGGDANASMGSLAPHNPQTANGAHQEWVADSRSNCRALDSNYDSGDSVQWQGTCAGGMASGRGTLSFLNNGHVLETITGDFGNGTLLPGHVSAAWSDGSKFDGDQYNGQFNGTGNFVSATGDRIDGEWKAGALNGRATVIWSNGDHYDGEWKDGKSDGLGTEIWANGDRFDGLWKDGNPIGQKAAGQSAQTGGPLSTASATATAAMQVEPTVALPQDAPAPGSPAVLPLHDYVGKVLIAVDGSTITLDQGEGSLTRVVGLPSGVTQQTSFAFMSDRIGTVSNDSAAIGLFRASGDEIDTNYVDGKTEVMKPGSSGGILLTSRTPDGNSTCTAWYPEEHAFSQDEKKAAVEEYATRLGISETPAAKKHHAARPGAYACGGGFVTNIAAAVATSPMPPSPVTAERKSSVPAWSHGPAIGSPVAGMQAIPVRESTVHPIDAPYEPAAAPSAIHDVKFAGNTMFPQTVSPPAASSTSGAQVPADASQCLSVANNGEYWGFQNRCGTAVQFAYCEMSDGNPLTSCHHTSVSGSASANGFSALINATSLSSQGVDHEFRWMACDGGAGEVVPHLDSVDPPSGRCLRAVPTGSAAIPGPARS